MVDKEEIFDVTTKALAIAGGANWVLTGLGFNLIQRFTGTLPILENTIYVLAGAATVYQIVKNW